MSAIVPTEIHHEITLEQTTIITLTSHVKTATMFSYINRHFKTDKTHVVTYTWIR